VRVAAPSPASLLAMQGDLVRLARSIDAERADRLTAEFGARPLALLLGVAFPPLTPRMGWQADAIERLASGGWRSTHRRADASRALRSAFERPSPVTPLVAFRRAVWAEKARIALRELLPLELGGAELESTARELSLLADASLEIALREAAEHVAARYGEPRRADGGPSRLVVFGMGKLGGLELNAGSDVDVVFVYDTDDGESAVSLHEHWTHVVRRAVETLETPSEDGLVWRVDLRLRPEGSQGAIANSVDATERYYVTYGRLWERAALVRSRAAAGDLALGALLEREVIQPFVYRRSVDTTLPSALVELVERQRDELSSHPERDLKLGIGGIREAETFVQALQLVWGGAEPSVRAKNTHDALARLQSRGLVSDGEAQAIGEGYSLLRKLEHRVQWMSGLQTHLLPDDEAELDRLGRTLRLRDGAELLDAVSRVRDAIHQRFDALAPAAPSRPVSRFEALAALFGGEPGPIEEAAERAFGSEEIGEHLAALARRPNDLFGVVTRERWPDLAVTALDELGASADPHRAARTLRSFFARFASPDPYLSAVALDRQALRRLVTAFASSAFIGDAVVARPELADVILFGGGAISDPRAAVEVEIDAQARQQGPDDADAQQALVSGLRIAKQRVMVEVAVADLAGSIGTREATRLLSALADEELSRAIEHVLGDDGGGLAVLAMGKLGGRDIGYGSDLDVIFVYDPARAPEADDAGFFFTTRAQRVIRLVSEPHAAGPGYELDTRLRPSGSQGMLVTSIEAFARYHGLSLDGQRRTSSAPISSYGAQAWERQALVRARFCAGDAELGARAMEIAERAAYETAPPAAEQVHRLRERMERELARETPERFDLKTGRGGLLDVEVCVQLVQMRHGSDRSVRTPDTPEALEALATAGYLEPADYEAFREGYRYLRRLEQRIHVLGGTSSSLIAPRGPGMAALARRMGYRDAPGTLAVDALVAQYRDVTRTVRAAYERVLGLNPSAAHA
ncbi:MAG TPA: bifunctional [glutamate--ammonia ligase]-adenylyl-L-tyrosine phosphorylase/[glutamate--ammonia-ligase] adenylyltransferase, partial [Polyangiaceae bacterium]